jgi:DNA-binding MurR/RpiR family transcriptional regulator
MLRLDEKYVSLKFMVQLEQTIRDQYHRLPAGERKIADILLEMQGELAVYSATELAEKAGVSKATATRLVQRLGFSDFQQMRNRAREAKQKGSPLAALPDIAGQRGPFGRHLNHEVASLTQTLEGISSERVGRAIDILTKAGRIWVIGFRNSHVLALYARELLVQVKPDVRLLPAPGQTIAEEFSALSSDDAVLIMGFRRRPPIIAKIIRTAAKTQARMILFDDPSLGDIDRSTDVTFRCLSRGSSVFDSYAAAMSLINYLCAEVAMVLGKGAQQRLRLTEQLHEEFGEL